MLHKYVKFFRRFFGFNENEEEDFAYWINKYIQTYIENAACIWSFIIKVFIRWTWYRQIIWFY